MAYIDTSKVSIPKGFFEDLNVPKLLDWLNSQPTADVEEVKHGEWISEFGTFGRVICSVCRSQCPQETELDHYGVRKPTSVYVMSNYCPNCGAKMDGGKTE